VHQAADGLRLSADAAEIEARILEDHFEGDLIVDLPRHDLPSQLVNDAVRGPLREGTALVHHAEDSGHGRYFEHAPAIHDRIAMPCRIEVEQDFAAVERDTSGADGVPHAPLRDRRGHSAFIVFLSHTRRARPRSEIAYKARARPFALRAQRRRTKPQRRNLSI
jgi:hypothetical protein